MINIDREIQAKKVEVETLTRMLDNAKKDLRMLENMKKESDKKQYA